MKVYVEFVPSSGIRAEMKRDSYTTADLLGTYTHPNHDGKDWEVTLWEACDTLVFSTNGDPVWEGTEAFEQLVSEYGITLP